jgi:S1-C subfamily serine protease
MIHRPILRRTRPGLLALATALASLALPLHARSDAAPRAVVSRGPLAADELANIEIFRKTSPSVVHITTLAAQRDLFSLNVQQVPRGTGTGFVWDELGHIVTNFHVIQGGSAARVTLADQSSYDAELVGAFPDRDLAVLRIKAGRDKLPPITLGSSRDLIVGQRVYAIVNPFGLDQTLTTGIVSALNREIDSFNQRTIKGVIQTDAAINPGNSGGRCSTRPGG